MAANNWGFLGGRIFRLDLKRNSGTFFCRRNFLKNLLNVIPEGAKRGGDT